MEGSDQPRDVLAPVSGLQLFAIPTALAQHECLGARILDATLVLYNFVELDPGAFKKVLLLDSQLGVFGVRFKKLERCFGGAQIFEPGLPYYSISGRGRIPRSSNSANCFSSAMNSCFFECWYC